MLNSVYDWILTPDISVEMIDRWQVIFQSSAVSTPRNVWALSSMVVADTYFHIGV